MATKLSGYRSGAVWVILVVLSLCANLGSTAPAAAAGTVSGKLRGTYVRTMSYVCHGDVFIYSDLLLFHYRATMGRHARAYTPIVMWFG